jgi:ice-binding like protein
VLKANVYDSAAGTFQITGTLTLDGQHNPDATFIFQTESTLKTAVASRVTFINGAQACNVFWQVGSAATLDTDSLFGGTIMAHDSISLNDGVTVEGRLLAGEQASGAGAVTLIHDTITRPVCAPRVPPTSASPTPSPSPTASVPSRSPLPPRSSAPPGLNAPPTTNRPPGGRIPPNRPPGRGSGPPQVPHTPHGGVDTGG